VNSDFKPVISQFVSGNILSPCIASLIFAIVTMALRHHDIARARQLTVPDRRSYDNLWAAIMADPSASPGLESLCTRSADLARTLPRNPPRQCVRLKQQARAAPLHPSPAAPGVPGEGQTVCSAIFSRCLSTMFPWLMPARNVHLEGPIRALPVDCLDQLFVQAQRVHPLLLAKVRTTLIIVLCFYVCDGDLTKYSMLTYTAKRVLY
jgi:hypothetical protein